MAVFPTNDQVLAQRFSGIRFLHWFRSNELQWIVVPLTAYALTRLVVLLGLVVGIIRDDVHGDFLQMWVRWDAEHYINIVDQGYTFVENPSSDDKARVNFFPLYPAMMGLLKPVAGNNTAAAGLLISNLAFIGALMVLYRLTLHEFNDSGTARRTVYYLAAFPTAFFFSAIYTESVFLLVSLLSIYYARKRNWLASSLFAALASATRSPGILLMAFITLEWMTSQGWKLSAAFQWSNWQLLLRAIRHDYQRLLIIVLIPPLGLFLYMAYLQITFHNPFAFADAARSVWGRSQVGPLATFQQALTEIVSRSADFLSGNTWQWWDLGRTLFDIFTLLAVLAIALVMWKRLGISYSLYSILAILMPASSAYVAFTRYALVIFPVFMMIGWWVRGRRASAGLMLVLLLGLCFLSWRFLANYWVA